MLPEFYGQGFAWRRRWLSCQRACFAWAGCRAAALGVGGLRLHIHGASAVWPCPEIVVISPSRPLVAMHIWNGTDTHDGLCEMQLQKQYGLQPFARQMAYHSRNSKCPDHPSGLLVADGTTPVPPQGRDLTPNIGLHWYFFSEMFAHFAPFWHFVFHAAAAAATAPLLLRLPHRPLAAAVAQAVASAMLKPYPSVADVAQYLVRGTFGLHVCIFRWLPDISMT